MVLGDVQPIKARLVIGLGETQAVLVLLGERRAGPVHVVEDAELQPHPGIRLAMKSMIDRPTSSWPLPRL